MEPAPVDPVAEWAAAGGETGLEEPMWQLGLGGGPDSYPERPDEPDCIYYLKTGFCGYGSRCRFNHPRDRVAIGALRSSVGGEYPERAGQPICQHYMRTGMCKFGASCKYHHPKQGGGSSAPVLLNYYGYPLRPGEKECSYYMKTSQCKFGVTCKFHHPQQQVPPPPVPEPGPAPLPGPTAMHAPSGFPTLQSPIHSSYGLIQGNWPVGRPPMLPGPYGPGSYGPVLIPPGVVPVPGWTPYPDYMVQAPVSPVATPAMQQPTVGSVPAYGITQFSPSGAAYTGPYLPVASSSAAPSGSIQRENPFPERPGQPECQHYLRTGDCKFGPACKYHHPPELIASRASFVLSPMGLPLRPAAPVCSHYARNGVCRFGPSCKYDHPMRMSYSPSASSLTDMPVAPYPVGSTNATLAPSSSSSDLRPEISSGPSKDTFPSQMNTSSASVGSLFSSSEAIAGAASAEADVAKSS